MIDPLVWAMTPGMGRAPSLAPAPVTQDPRADLIRLMAGATVRRTEPGGPMDPRDRPRAFAPDPATLNQQQLEGFHEGYGGWNDPTRMGRAPGAVGGGLASLAGAGVPGLGTALGYMGNKGAQDYQRQLQAERTQRMAQAMESGAQQRESGAQQRPSPTAFADAYEAGRQAATRRPEREQRGGGDIGGRDNPQSPASRGGRGGQWA